MTDSNKSQVYITFPSAFWDVEEHPTSTPPPRSKTSSRQETPNTTAITAPVHQPNQDEDKDSQQTRYPGFTHWLAPTYSPSNPSSWCQQALNLAALPGETAHPTLLFYVFDACARHIASLAASSSPDADADGKLLAFFEPYFSRLPGYSDARPECIPKAVLATSWATDELAGFGSYSNFQVGLERGDEDIECMRRGMPERGVWIAGEHTAPFVALGTVTGAYWAGEGVARRIVEGYDGLGGAEKVEMS